jgi:very-short-patch-repair endonuclease
MDIKKIHRELVDYIASTKNEEATTQFLIFESLCTKAKEILWSFISGSKNDFLYSKRLYSFEGLTPIEQIFNAILCIYEYVSNESFYFEIIPQYEIQIRDKTYIADFCCKSFVFDGTDWFLDKNIVIECDGYESHHTKEQRNRDIYRENELKLNGYSVIRFTGTQIYNNPYSCFEKALYFIIDENKKCIQKAFDEVNNNGKI